MTALTLADRDAVISVDGLYRYRLSRIWDGRKLPLVWIMLNPSTADAIADDPTIRRCQSFSHREGAGGLIVLNLFAYRATDPKQLRAVADPIGPDNDEWIDETLHRHSRVIVAWGTKGSILQRDAVVLRRLLRSRIQILALGWTKGGGPLHPLYVAGNQPMQALDPARRG